MKRDQAFIVAPTKTKLFIEKAGRNEPTYSEEDKANFEKFCKKVVKG